VLLTLNNVVISHTVSATGNLSLVLNSSSVGAGAVNIQGSTLSLNGGGFTANGNGNTSNLDGIDVVNSIVDTQGGSTNLTGRRI